jgi:multiple sugar transport system ATP-binding protein
VARVTLKGIGKRFGRVDALRGIDLEIGDGEFCCFVGPSGCGKSTLLRLIAGLEDPSAGEISIGGAPVNDLPPARRGIAMVFQSYALYPHMTVYQNMAFGLQQARLDRHATRARILDAARMLQIEPLLDRLPRQLSGGQRQRVAIGRAIVRQPQVFLFDEPLSNLDATLRQQTRTEIARLHARLGSTMIYVTHDQVEAMTLADKIVVLRDGNIEQVGCPMDLYHHPANRFVASFIGTPPMNFLRGRLAADGPAVAVRLENDVRLSAAVDSSRLPDGASVSLGVRPEHVGLVAVDQAGLVARVVLRELLGDHSLVLLQPKGLDTDLTAKVAPGAEPAVGESVGIRIAADHAHLFDEHGQACRRTSRKHEGD